MKELPEDREIETPDGVTNRNRIKLDDDDPEAVAYLIPPGEFNDPPRAFNPNNGRWYSNLSVPRYDETEYEHKVQLDCAYRDCDGIGEIEVVVDVDCDCPECGAEDMGRGDFQ